MRYDETWLWKTAFVDERADASTSEQQYFAQRYSGMRDKASALVARIGADLASLTVHDVTHLDALWEMASIVAREAVDLNPPEAFVFGGAVLLHDAAMSLAAYPRGLQDLRGTLTWRDTRARLSAVAAEANEETSEELLDQLATADALRTLHAAQAQKLPLQAWYGSDSVPEFLIDDPEVRNFYGPKMGEIAHSHWWPVERLEEEFGNDLGPLGGRTSNKIDLLKIASLLRVSDAMHIDKRRAPAFLRKLLNPEGLSALHWTFQERMAVPYIEEQALVYSAAPAFELTVAESWWLAFEALEVIDRELQQVDHLLQTRGSFRLLVNRVKGISSPIALSKFVETEGWVPVDSRIRVSDVPKIVGTLGGRRLYGSDLSAPARELIQNAADAVNARRRLQARAADWGSIAVELQLRSEEYWLVVEDTGIGMSAGVMTGPLIDFGNSFWRSPLASEEFPGLQSAGHRATGRYGIGFFSVFMLGDHVKVISRRFDRGTETCSTLEFRNGLSSRPILYQSPPSECPVDGGTRVEVKLHRDPTDEDGLLWRDIDFREELWTLGQLVSWLAPSLDVEISVRHLGESGVAVRANDWLDLSEDELLSRISGQWETRRKLKKGRSGRRSDSRLRLITAEDGQVVGRAMIDLPFHYSSRGCITVGGLRSSEIDNLAGVLVGREYTASRNEGRSVITAERLSSWSTEQAQLISKAALEGDMMSRAAQIILSCGGEIGNLPVARLGGCWLSTEELRAALDGVNEIFVSEDSAISYDEDIDDVHPRDFSEKFEEAEHITFLPTPARIGSGSGAVLAGLAKSGPQDSDDVLRDLLQEVWGGYYEEDVETVIGTVGGTKIERDTISFSRTDDSP